MLAGVCWMMGCLLGFLPMFGWYNHDALKEVNSTSFNCEFKAVIPVIIPGQPHFLQRLYSSTGHHDCFILLYIF